MIYISYSKTVNNNMEEAVMAHKITDACLACGTCVPECPVEAISEGDPIYVINAGKCTDCGACASVCPAEAITKT
jgi:ferredoxin